MYWCSPLHEVDHCLIAGSFPWGLIVAGEASDIQESIPRKWGNDNYCSKNTSNPLPVPGPLAPAMPGTTRGE